MRNRKTAPGRRVVSYLLAAVATAALGLSLPAIAGAAGVVNGDFESGTLTGWTTFNNSSHEEPGSWFAYSGTAFPLGEVEEGLEVPPPPQGKYAAISAQAGPGTHILYQDVAIPLYASSALSLLVYYQSGAPLATPNPNTLSFFPNGLEGEEAIPNQQYRVDVIKPTAPLETLSPSDVLATVFATATGGPQALAPTLVEANLSAFAGQTVRLRLTEVDNQYYFPAGADSVALVSTPINKFSFGKLKLNKKKGTAKLQVKVPGPGKIVGADVRKTGKRIKTARATAGAPGTVKLSLKPTAGGMKTLEEAGKLRFKLKVTFKPTGGSAASKKRSGTLKLTL